MLESLKEQNKVVGTRRLVKAIEADKVKCAYIAMDADLFISRQVTDLCREKRIPIVEVNTMKELGEACGIQVPAAAAGILR